MKYILIPYPKNEKRNIKKIWFMFDKDTETTTPYAFVKEYEIIDFKHNELINSKWVDKMIKK